MAPPADHPPERPRGAVPVPDPRAGAPAAQRAAAAAVRHRRQRQDHHRGLLSAAPPGTPARRRTGHHDRAAGRRARAPRDRRLRRRARRLASVRRRGTSRRLRAGAVPHLQCPPEAVLGAHLPGAGQGHRVGDRSAGGALRHLRGVAGGDRGPRRAPGVAGTAGGVGRVPRYLPESPGGRALRHGAGLGRDSRHHQGRQAAGEPAPVRRAGGALRGRTGGAAGARRAGGVYRAPGQPGVGRQARRDARAQEFLRLPAGIRRQPARRRRCAPRRATVSAGCRPALAGETVRAFRPAAAHAAGIRGPGAQAGAQLPVRPARHPPYRRVLPGAVGGGRGLRRDRSDPRRAAVPGAARRRVPLRPGGVRRGAGLHRHAARAAVSPRRRPAPHRAHRRSQADHQPERLPLGGGARALLRARPAGTGGDQPQHQLSQRRQHRQPGQQPAAVEARPDRSRQRRDHRALDLPWAAAAAGRGPRRTRAARHHPPGRRRPGGAGAHRARARPPARCAADGVGVYHQRVQGVGVRRGAAVAFLGDGGLTGNLAAHRRRPGTRRGRHAAHPPRAESAVRGGDAGA